jgi:hypothetical protein
MPGVGLPIEAALQLWLKFQNNLKHNAYYPYVLLPTG